jgi:ketosteroid isomerase-like protein
MTDRRDSGGMTSISTPTIDVDALRLAYANRSVEGLLALYAEDATVEIVDAVHMPSHPHRLTGREALRAHFEDVFARDMTHETDIVAATPSALGLSLRCTYADGTKVVCAATAVVRDGLIVREVGVQAWDA